MKYREDERSGKLIEALANAPAARQRDMLFDYFGALTAKILDLPAAEVPKLGGEHRLFELGLSSLFIVELKNQLEDAVQAELPLTLFFTHADLGSLADYLIDEVITPTTDKAAAPAPVASADDVPDEHEDPDDPEAALLRKIAEVDEKY